MKRLLFIALCAFSINLWAQTGFRIESGKLISLGDQKSDVYELLGEPIFKDKETQGIDTGEQNSGTSVETWVYQVNGDLGGKFQLTLKFNGSELVTLTSKQLERI